MRRFVFLLILMLIISAAGESDSVKITHSKNINVRAKPSTESNVVGTGVSGEEYEYLGTADNGWLHIRLSNGVEGYVSGKMAVLNENVDDEEESVVIDETHPEKEEADKSSSDMPLAYLEIPPLPEPNTDKNIVFKGIKWWSDYKTVIQAAKKLGYPDSPHEHAGWWMDAVHWNYAFSRFGFMLESRCNAFFVGGRLEYSNLTFDNILPTIAGHKLEKVELYFLVNPEKGTTEEYKDKGVLQFYMATYVFDDGSTFKYDENSGETLESVYHDLETKLTSIYGTPGHNYRDREYVSYWVNQENAAIVLGISGNVCLSYMAPNAEERLIKLENQMRAYGTPTPDVTPAPTPTPYDIKGL